MANHMVYNPLQIRRIIYNMSFRQQSALVQPLTGEGRTLYLLHKRRIISALKCIIFFKQPVKIPVGNRQPQE